MCERYAHSQLIAPRPGISLLQLASTQAGGRLTDPGADLVVNRSGRRDVDWRQIVLPEILTPAVPRWAVERDQLWSVMQESALQHPDQWAAQHWRLGLPAGACRTTCRSRGLGVARLLADTYGVAVDMTVFGFSQHSTPPEVQMIVSGRQVTAQGLGAFALVFAEEYAPAFQSRREQRVLAWLFLVRPDLILRPEKEGVP